MVRAREELWKPTEEAAEQASRFGIRADKSASV